MIFGLAAAALTATNTFAAQINVAGAAHFIDASKEIATAFNQKTGDDAVLSFGLSGQLYA